VLQISGFNMEINKLKTLKMLCSIIYVKHRRRERLIPTHNTLTLIIIEAKWKYLDVITIYVCPRIIHGSDRAGLGLGPLLLTYNQDRWKKQKIKQIEYCFQKQKTELNCTKQNIELCEIVCELNLWFNSARHTQFCFFSVDWLINYVCFLFF
jgi:hypothetical protein